MFFESRIISLNKTIIEFKSVGKIISGNWRTDRWNYHIIWKDGWLIKNYLAWGLIYSHFLIRLYVIWFIEILLIIKKDKI